MGPSSTDRRLTEQGVTSVQFLLAGALGLLLFLALGNLVVVQFGRGAIRSALDQGARVGAITGSPSACEAKVDEVLDQLLAGAMGEGVESNCVVGPSSVEARGMATFRSWTPITPDFEVELTSRAVMKNAP